MKTPLLQFIFAILFLSASVAQGQNNYESGYVIAKGDTLKGLIEYRNWKKNPKKIVYKKNESSESVVYTPTSIDVFFVRGERYTSGIVQVESSPYRESELNHSPELHFRTDTVFLRTLVSGDKSLYYYNDAESKEHFIIYNNGRYEALVYKTYLKYVSTSSNETYFAYVKNYLSQLSHYLNDCSSISQYLKDVPYQRSTLLKIFQRYNECVGVKTELAEQNEKILLKPGIIAGLSVSKVKNFSGSDFLKNVDPIRRINSNAITAFSLGASLDIMFPRNEYRWSMRNELMFSKINYVGQGEVYNNSTDYNLVSYHFDVWDVRFSTMGRYRIPFNNKASLFMNTGLSFSKPLSSQQNNFESDRVLFNSNTNTVENNFFDEEFQLGILFGAGLLFKDFSFEARSEFGNQLNANQAQANLNRFYFLFSLRF